MVLGGGGGSFEWPSGEGRVLMGGAVPGGRGGLTSGFSGVGGCRMSGLGGVGEFL